MKAVFFSLFQEVEMLPDILPTAQPTLGVDVIQGGKVQNVQKKIVSDEVIVGMPKLLLLAY